MICLLVNHLLMSRRCGSLLLPLLAESCVSDGSMHNN